MTKPTSVNSNLSEIQSEENIITPSLQCANRENSNAVTENVFCDVSETGDVTNKPKFSRKIPVAGTAAEDVNKEDSWVTVGKFAALLRKHICFSMPSKPVIVHEMKEKP
ncbi:hypothetical protein C0J52_17377 [Blattella germanica]|nr:hypothetical protein C0J52_17377 [Blattella germanica]